MLKPFVINPWMFDVSHRLTLWAGQKKMPFPAAQQWGFLEGFRRADQDVDRLPGNWIETWHETVQSSLGRAHHVYQNHPPERTVIDFSHFEKDVQNGKILLLDYAPDHAAGLDKQLSAKLIEGKDHHQQIWINLPDQSFPSPLALQASLRLGAAWWCSPPVQKSDWELYVEQQEKWSDTILRNPNWDQWVWPWGQFIEQGLRLYAQGQKPSAQKFTPPEGWSDRRQAGWGSLGMKVWTSAQKSSEEIWEDRWIGVLSGLVLSLPASCKKTSAWYNDAQ